MRKDEFYNEHVKDSRAYRMFYGSAGEDEILDETGRIFGKGVVTLSKLNYRKGMDASSPEVAASDISTGLSVNVADKFLRGSAMCLDDDSDERWIVNVCWKDNSGLMRRSVICVNLGMADRENEHIIEQRLVDKYVETYEKKLENAMYGSHKLQDMLRLPELRSYMLTEAKSFVVENYISSGRHLVTDCSGNRDSAMEVWMVPGSSRPAGSVSKGRS